MPNAMATTATASRTQTLLARRNIVLAMLLIVYILNFLDRQILGIIAEPIKRELHLTDTQLGTLGGAVGLLFSVLGLPLAILADRTSRSWVVTVALAVWSGFTALCGIATGFWQLFAFRLGVGIGEAGGPAPSYALIADYFPPERRSRALAIYSLGIPLGLAGGAIIAGQIAQAYGWRTAFIGIGLAGVVVTPLFKYLVRDLPRPATAATVARPPILAVFAILARKRSFWLISVAAAFSSTVGYALAFWAPSVLIRSFGFSLSHTANFFGSLVLIGGTAGVLAGGWLSDTFGNQDRGVYAKLCAAAWLATGPLYVAGFLSSSPTWAWLLLLPANGLTILWLGPVARCVQHLVPPPMRATATASFLLVNNLIGLGLGPRVMGLISDAMTARYGHESLRYSAVALLLFYPLAAITMWLAVRPLRREWVEETPTERP